MDDTAERVELEQARHELIKAINRFNEVAGYEDNYILVDVGRYQDLLDIEEVANAIVKGLDGD